MWSAIEKLKDPELVWNFQYYFGIRRKENGSATASSQHNGGVDEALVGANNSSHANGYHQKPTHLLTNGWTKKNGIVKNGHVNHDKNGKIYSSNSVTVTGENTITDRNKSKESQTTSESDSESNSSGSGSTEGSSSGNYNHHRKEENFRITLPLWYYIFSFGALLGDEAFYISFFPFWFWNIDGAVCRRVATIWVLIMYVGQSLKDIIRWPRPKCPPVIRLEEKWMLEYGMPSTHAMVATAVPFSFLYYTMYRYEYPVILGVIVCSVWCILVCFSRLYLGMHTALDVIVGVLLVVILMFVIIPFIDSIDYFTLTWPYSPLCILTVYILMIVFYPDAGRWTPARGDSVIILGAGAGVALGSWLNFQWGIIRGPPMPPPYQILWPTYEMIGITLLRTCIGILIVMATRAFFKSITYAVVCHLFKLDPRNKDNHKKLIVESSSKFITYTAIAFNATYFSPAVFRFLNIERATMFTEV